MNCMKLKFKFPNETLYSEFVCNILPQFETRVTKGKSDYEYNNYRLSPKLELDPVLQDYPNHQMWLNLWDEVLFGRHDIKAEMICNKTAYNLKLIYFEMIKGDCIVIDIERTD